MALMNYDGKYVLITEDFYADLKSNQVLEGFELYISTYNMPIEQFKLYTNLKTGFMDLPTTVRIGSVGFDFYDNRLLSIDMSNQNSGAFNSFCLFYRRRGVEELLPAFYIILNQTYVDSTRIQTISDTFNIFNFDLSPIEIRAKLISYNHRSVSTHNHDMSKVSISTSGADSTRFFQLYLQNRDAPNTTYEQPTSTSQTVIITNDYNFSKVSDGSEIRNKSELNQNMITPSVQRSMMKNINEVYYVNSKSAIKLLGETLPHKTTTSGWVYFYKPNDPILYKCSLESFLNYLGVSNG